jgi:hypothetical protein
MASVTPEWLFQRAGLIGSGPVAWGQRVPTMRPGVYVIEAEGLPIDSQRVVYIGRSKCLYEHLHHFYRHSAKAPHAGGQIILALPDEKFVYWAETGQYGDAEYAMLEAFRETAGASPIGNKVKSRRPSQTLHPRVLPGG